jgi:two-component system, cell cycle response regulator
MREDVVAVSERSRPGGLGVTVSLGVAAAKGADVAEEQLIAVADEALYEAKRTGRNRVVSRQTARVAELESALKAPEPKLA